MSTQNETRVSGPWVQIAAFCQNAIVDNTTGYLSIINVFDRVVLVGTTQDIQPAPLKLTLVVVLKSDDIRGQHQIKVRSVSPSQKSVDSPEIPFLFEGGDRGVQAVLPFGIIVTQQGLHWFEIVMEDDTVLSRVPLHVIY